MRPKVTGVPILRISRLPLKSPETKCHLDANHVTNHIIYYKGEGDGFPQVWVVMSLLSLSLLAARLNAKSALAMH